MSGITRYILSENPDDPNIADKLTPEAIANCNPEESGESVSEEKEEHASKQEAEGK